MATQTQTQTQIQIQTPSAASFHTTPYTSSYPSSPSTATWYSPSTSSHFTSASSTDSDFPPVEAPEPSPIKKFRLRIRMPSKHNLHLSSNDGSDTKRAPTRFPVRMRTLKELRNSSMRLLPRKRRIMVSPEYVGSRDGSADGEYSGYRERVRGGDGDERAVKNRPKSYAEMDCEILGQHWLFPVPRVMRDRDKVVEEEKLGMGLGVKYCGFESASEEWEREMEREEVGRETGFGWEWYGGVRRQLL